MPHESMVMRATFSDAGTQEIKDGVRTPEEASQQITDWLDDVKARGGQFLFSATLECQTDTEAIGGGTDSYEVLVAEVPEAAEQP